MQFDTATLFQLLVLQSLLMALALPLLMGWRRSSRGARHTQVAAGLHAAAWLLMLAAWRGGPSWFIGLGLAMLSGSLSALWMALSAWLGRRRGRRPMLALPALVLGLYLLMPGPALHQAGPGALLGLQMLALCWSLTQPAEAMGEEMRRVSRRWRGMLLVALLGLALLFLWRGIVLALGGPASGGAGPVAAAVAPALLLGLAAVLLSLAALLVAWHNEAECAYLALAQTDMPTGLGNRGAFLSRSVDMISMSRRYSDPLVLVMLEIDEFAALSERHGPAVADQALRLFGRCLREQMRLGDFSARLAGHQFGVLMARCQTEGPQALDTRLRDALTQAAPGELGFALGFSAGWARLRHGDRNLDDLMRRATAALYEVRREGQGRLQAEPGLEDESQGRDGPGEAQVGGAAGTGLA